MSDIDPYWKLRPPPPTPADELCSCSELRCILLRGTFAENPLACAQCNLEVLPERLALPPQLADDLATWRSFHNCFYLLWLDSGEFEAWARAQLSDPQSPVNLRGRSVRAELDRVRRAYYWWFQDTGAEDFVPPTSCPICSAALADTGLVGTVCETCFVLVAN